jgi:hypothetical protein
MRDILNKLKNIVEANLAFNTLPATKASKVKNPTTGQPLTRQELFLQKIQQGSPFTTTTGDEVVIDPGEETKVAQWFSTGPKGVLSLATADGGQIKNTELLKTVEFGSSESETIKLKGSDIFDVPKAQKDFIKDINNNVEEILQAGGFPVSQMYEKIANSTQMAALGKTGDAVILMAREANEGRVPTYPPGLRPAEEKAIELYASEYIGVMGLVSGSTPFMRGTRADFDKFVGINLSDMIVYFPKDTSNPLADSFSIENDENGHAVKISSKAAGKGAAPSMASLKFPAQVAEKYPDVAEFHRIATQPGVDTFQQSFVMMNWLANHAPETIPAEYGPLLPFSDETMFALMNSLKKNTPVDDKLKSVFDKRISSKIINDPKSTYGGKAWSAVTADVMAAVNKKNALPDFQAAVIESLGYNFIQLYSNNKGGKLVSQAFWPGKVNGTVVMKTKAGAPNPFKGKMSFELSAGKGVDESEELTPASPEVVPERPKDNIKKYGRPFQR